MYNLSHNKDVRVLWWFLYSWESKIKSALGGLYPAPQHCQLYNLQYLNHVNIANFTICSTLTMLTLPTLQFAVP